MKTTIKNNELGLNVTIKHFGMPGEAPNLPLFSLPRILTRIQESNGWGEHAFSIFNPLYLVSDMCLHQKKNIIVSRMINHDGFVEAMKKEAFEFIGDLSCYLHASGAIYGNEIQDACWSLFNAIKDYVFNKWSKENAAKYFAIID